MIVIYSVLLWWSTKDDNNFHSNSFIPCGEEGANEQDFLFFSFFFSLV